MPVRKLIALLSVSTFLMVGLLAQSSVRIPNDLWRVLFFTPGDQEAAATITEAVNAGYAPVGYELEEDETLSVLLVERGDLEIAGWVINEYTDFTSFEQEFTGAIASGFVPMDISRYGNTISVLWIEAEVPIDGWRIHSTANTIEARADAINAFRQQGFELWGLSISEDEAWFLFIDSGTSSSVGLVSGYPKTDAALQQGLLESNAAGWLPNGFAIDANRFFVSMTKVN